MASGAILILGITSSALSVMSWLALLFVMLSSGWIVWSESRKRTKKKLLPSSVPPMFPPAFMPEVQRQGRMSVWIGLPLVAILAVTAAYQIGKDRGYGIRDRQLIENQLTYTDVAILKKVSDREFFIWPDRMKQQHITICPESTVGWYAGELLDDWTFEQRNGCKRVISYHEKPKGEIDAAIQTR